MNHYKRSLWGFGALAILTCAMLLGAQAYAQQTQPDQNPNQPASQQPDQYPTQPSAQQPEQQTPPQQPPASQQPPAQQQPPDQTQTRPSGMPGQASDAQVFTGTIVKSGSKYMLQDSTGKTYDLDHQDMLPAHEGKQVRFKGVLDPDGKTIHIQ